MQKQPSIRSRKVDRSIAFPLALVAFLVAAFLSWVLWQGFRWTSLLDWPLWGYLLVLSLVGTTIALFALGVCLVSWSRRPDTLLTGARHYASNMMPPMNTRRASRTAHQEENGHE